MNNEETIEPEAETQEEEVKLDKMELIPDGFVYIGTGPLKRQHFSPNGDDLIIWLESEWRWKLIGSQGANHCHYAAREGSDAHLSNQ